MEPAKTTTTVEKEIQQLEVAVKNEHAARTRAAKSARMVTTLLCATILFFVLLNFFYFHSHWTEDNFKRSIEKEMVELSPVALREINALGRDLLPVYADEGQRQLSILMPKVSETLERELQLLGEELIDEVHEQLRESLFTLHNNTHEQMLDYFPDLRERANQEQLQKQFRETTEKAVLSSLVEFDQRFSQDIQDVTDSLLKFKIENTSVSTVDLRKKFLHLWLRLLDLEVMEL